MNGEEKTAITISANDFRALCMPGVYVFWRLQVGSERVALYIGSSRRVISRMSNPNHDQAQRALRECTQVELILCKNEIEARALEQRLIDGERPLYNVRIRK